mgnify:CR=1 FL=1
MNNFKNVFSFQDNKFFMNIYKEEKPWGNFERFVANEQCTVKLLTVNPQESLSLQYHKNRDEFWKILEGNPRLTIGEETIVTKPNEEYFIPRGTKHRVSSQDEIVRILEIMLGEYDENDIVHLEDKYGRMNKYM